MLKITKTLLATGLIAASSSAFAIGETFTVDPTIDLYNNTQTGVTTFSANQILGNYNEGVRINGEVIGGVFVPDGTFDASIVVNLNSFAINTGGIAQNISGTITGIGDTANYQLYATIVTSGSLVFGQSGDVQGFSNFGGMLEFFLDLDKDTNVGDGTIFTNTPSGVGIGLTGTTADLGLADSTDDIKIGEALTIGGGTNFGVNSSSFFLTSEAFELTAAGESFFIEPNPFYIEFFSSGNITGLLADINAGDVGANGLYNFTSGVEIEFRIPEPSALAFLGLGLIGAGFMSRRRKS